MYYKSNMACFTSEYFVVQMTLSTHGLFGVCPVWWYAEWLTTSDGKTVLGTAFRCSGCTDWSSSGS